MKKWIIAAAILLTSVTVANAGGVRCEIVQVLPGFFLPRCDNYARYENHRHSRNDYNRWGHERGGRDNHYARNYNRYDRNDNGRKRHARVEKDIHDRPYRHDSHRW